MLTIFQLFAVRTEASVLRMLEVTMVNLIQHYPLFNMNAMSQSLLSPKGSLTTHLLIFTPSTLTLSLLSPQGSPNEFLHKPIVKYLEDRDVDIFLNKRVTELIYDKDEEGRPSVLKGFKTAAGWCYPIPHFDLINQSSGFSEINHMLTLTLTLTLINPTYRY